MELSEAQNKFLESWGKLGSQWGISRTMAQLHALLLISPKAMCADDIMSRLVISRGNANMNLRALIDWGLVYKVLKPGERKEFFVAEKDMWQVFIQILKHRKKRELEPILEVLDDLSLVKNQCTESEEFCQIVRDLKLLTNKADSTLDNLINTDSKKFVGMFLNMIK